MLRIEHLHSFYKLFFNEEKFEIQRFVDNCISDSSYQIIFSSGILPAQILFYEQEPLISSITEDYLDFFKLPFIDLPIEELKKSRPKLYQDYYISENLSNMLAKYKDLHILVTSEHSKFRDDCVRQWNLKHLYYFFHAFAAFDWYRGFNLINADKKIIKNYKYDFITFNRLICNDRSHRISFVSKLVEYNLIPHGQISFGLDNEVGGWQDEVRSADTKMSGYAKNHAEKYLKNINKLIIDREDVHGWASADIPLCVEDSFWHIVTETVFYYDKLHLTEKIFKPIVSKQPFMLLAAPGNLAYLKSYGFKTFDSVIDESYDSIQDPDTRIEAVIRQLQWYCDLTPGEKTNIIQQLEPIIEYNFHHFYGEFKHIVTNELLTNVKALYKEIGYDDSDIVYSAIYQALTH